MKHFDVCVVIAEERGGMDFPLMSRELFANLVSDDGANTLTSSSSSIVSSVSGCCRVGSCTSRRSPSLIVVVVLGSFIKLSFAL